MEVFKFYLYQLRFMVSSVTSPNSHQNHVPPAEIDRNGVASLNGQPALKYTCLVDDQRLQ